MTRAILFALSLSALAAPAAAQDDAAPLAGRILAPPLSPRAMPAAPPVHKLSIGPLSAPAEGATVAAPDRATPDRAAPQLAPERVAVPDAHTGDAAPDPLLRRANAGDADANYRLGLKYLAGEGVARDFVEAFARIRLAAEAGHPRALSLFYAMGARLTAEEHGKAYLRSQALRPAARAAHR